MGNLGLLAFLNKFGYQYKVTQHQHFPCDIWGRKLQLKKNPTPTLPYASHYPIPKSAGECEPNLKYVSQFQEVFEVWFVLILST